MNAISLAHAFHNALPGYAIIGPECIQEPALIAQ